MGQDIPGKIIGVILAFVLTIIMPFVTVTVEKEMLERRLIVNNACSFIDSVVDSRVVTQSELEELNLALASYGITVDYDIKRYAASVDPDPVESGAFSVTYLLQDDNMHYNQGDKISVHIYAIGNSTTANLAYRLSGIFMKNFDVTLTARVR